MAEFSWSYGRGRFFGHYGLLLFPCFLLSFPGKGQHIFLVFIVTYVFAVFFFCVVRVVSIFGSNMPKITSDFSHLTDIFSGHYG